MLWFVVSIVGLGPSDPLKYGLGNESIRLVMTWQVIVSALIWSVHFFLLNDLGSYPKLISSMTRYLISLLHFPKDFYHRSQEGMASWWLLLRLLFSYLQVNIAPHLKIRRPYISSMCIHLQMSCRGLTEWQGTTSGIITASMAAGWQAP